MKVFYHSLTDFFLRKRFLLLGLLLAYVLPRFFYGIYVFYYGDSAHYYFSLGNFRQYIDSFIAFGNKFNLNDKKVIFIISMFTTSIITVGIFRKGYLFSKSKIAATYTALLYLIHPLSVSYSGEPRLVHFTHSIFIAGIFLVINQNKKLLWKNLMGVFLLFISVKVNPEIYPYALLFFIFNIFEGVYSQPDKEQNYFILLGQALVFLTSSMIFLGWNNLVPLSTKVLEQVEYIVSIFTTDGKPALTVLPNLLDEYFRNLMKNYFSPVLIVFPFLLIGFGKELKLSNHSRGLYSFSFLVCSMYLLEFKNLSQGTNEQMYMGIILSILISSIGCHRLYNRFSYTYVRAFIIFFLPLSLTFGLFAKSYRDYYRQQSLVGLIPNLQKNIVQKNQTLFLPYGRNLNAKQFVQFRSAKALNLKKIPFLQKDDFSRILEGLNSAYLFVDDYFIFNFYWPGKFLLEIDDQIVLDELVIKKVFQGASKQNKGHLFFIQWKK